MRNLPVRAVNLEPSFDVVTRTLFAALSGGETLSAALRGEESLFARFNEGKVRQSGTVCEASLSCSLASEGREVEFSFPMTGNPDADVELGRARLQAARAMLAEALPDPFWVPPSDRGTSREAHEGRFPAPELLPELVGTQVRGLDFAGFYQGGRVVRAMANSKGTRHWFSTETFVLNYSLYLKNGRAVAASYAGREWDSSAFEENLAKARLHLDKLALPQRQVPRGKHRVYMAPSAVASMAGLMLFSFGTAAQRQKYTALLALTEGRASLSPKFNLSDDFSVGLVPRFSEDGTVSPELFPLVVEGRPANVYVSERSAKEYGLTPNAGPSEYVQSPVIGSGELPMSDALKALGTGLYISDLHYLNFSDRPNARITGMTRFACFWVEEGQIVAPIQDLRFDVTLYHAFGEGLEALTREREIYPATECYYGREVGGMLAPGAIIRDFEFTL